LELHLERQSIRRSRQRIGLVQLAALARHRPLLHARGALVIRVVLQAGVLWLFYRLGEALVAAWHLPIPAAVVGIAVVFTLLALAILREEWLAEACDLFLKHLAFFFIPVAVGIMAYRQLLWQNGLAFAFIVVA